MLRIDAPSIGVGWPESRASSHRWPPRSNCGAGSQSAVWKEEIFSIIFYSNDLIQSLAFYASIDEANKTERKKEASMISNWFKSISKIGNFDRVIFSNYSFHPKSSHKKRKPSFAQMDNSRRSGLFTSPFYDFCHDSIVH